MADDFVRLPDGSKRWLNLRPSDPDLVARRVRGFSPVVWDSKDIPDFDDFPSDVAVKDQNGYGACFPAGTPILTPAGPKPIEEVGIGDEVVSGEGVVRLVARTFRREYGPTIPRLVLDGLPDLPLTHNHQVMTRRGYVRADDLKTTDEVSTPAFAAAPGADGDDARPAWRLVRGIVEGPFRGTVYNLEVEVDHSYVAGGVHAKNCNGHAAATAVEFVRALHGLPHVDLSAWWVYGKLVRGRDQGSSIADALVLCEDEGVCSESFVKYGDFSGKYSKDASGDAGRHKILIGEKIPQSFDAILTAVARRRVLNCSVRATNGWDGRLDADGCPPVGAGPANHAIVLGGGIKTNSRGKRFVRMRNSWSTKWGDGGSCWLGEDHFARQSWFDAYTVIAVTSDPDDMRTLVASRYADVPGLEAYLASA